MPDRDKQLAADLTEQIDAIQTNLVTAWSRLGLTFDEAAEMVDTLEKLPTLLAQKGMIDPAD